MRNSIGEPSGKRVDEQGSSRWLFVLILFFLTSMVESIAMSHVFSFLPVYLQGMHVRHVVTWVGILNALIFVVGLPLIPLWGVWANRFGGKAIIIRSAYVEMIVLLALGWSHAFIGVFIAMLLVGFQLGNTGIMLSSIRSRVPRDQVGFAVSLFSVSSPVGMALGPLVGGWLIGAHVLDLHGLYMADGVLSLLTGTMLLVFYRDRAGVPQHPSEMQGSAWVAAWKSVRFTFGLRITWVLFGVYTVLMMARQMVNPYLPIAIEQLHIQMTQVTVTIGGMMGLTALVGAGMTVFTGRLGDKVGFTKILALAFGVCIPVTLLLGLFHRLLPFGLCLTLFSGGVSISGAMIFALFSTMIPESHRSTALNLVYLPMYLGGIVGPAISSGLAHLSLLGPFAGASVVFAGGLVLIFAMLRQSVRYQTAHGSETVQPILTDTL
jgi:MFS transporter, DHA1 family, multidrug resistance protein